MTNLKRNFVTMNVDKNFFDNLFEPARIKTQKKLGLSRLTQIDFSRMIFKGGLKLDVKLKDIGVQSGFTKNRKK